MVTTITREIAEKVRDVVDAGLVYGIGQPVPGQMCLEAAVCYAMGLPHGDRPPCVASSLRRLKIRLNDSPWSSPAARAQGLRRLAIAQLGSAGVLDEQAFVHRVAEMTIRSVVPIALRAAALMNPAHAVALKQTALECQREGTREAASRAHEAAADAAVYSAAYADAAYAAAVHAYAAADAAADADATAYADPAYAAADTRTYDRVLADYAERVVQILVEMHAPGCAYLDLVPTEVQ